MTDGASLGQQLVGAARSNNDTLAEELLHSMKPEKRAQIINETRDPVGNALLHVACGRGSLEFIDYILDQEGVEIDPRNQIGFKTPLHLAVEYATSSRNDVSVEIVQTLIEAGASPDLRDTEGKRPIDLARQEKLEEIEQILRGAQLAAEMMRDQLDEGGTPSDSEEEGESRPSRG